MSARFPNFLIIGAARSGTTSLYHYLRQHPQIFMSAVKEPRYFACVNGYVLTRRPVRESEWSGTISDRERYRELFAGAGDAVAVGEASPVYLFSPGCPERIAAEVPDMRLIAILRNPVDRAYSIYNRRVREGREIRSFEEVLSAPGGAIEPGYCEALERYREVFGPSRVMVKLYEDLRDTPSLYRDLCGFLDVDPSFPADFRVRHNAAGRPRLKRLQVFLSEENRVKRSLKPLIPEQWAHRFIAWFSSRNLRRAAIPPGVRRRLLDAHRADIERLEGLIDRDLSRWLV